MSRVIFLIATLILGSLGSPPLQLEPLSGPIDFVSPIPEQSQVRLPLNIIPSHYDLTIRPIINKPLDDPEQFTAPGRVTITVMCKEATDVITMHSNDIDIEQQDVVVLNRATGVGEQIRSFSNDSSVSTWSIHFAAPLSANMEYTIEIPFTARVGNRLSGLYRSWYKDANGNDRYLATTQFQSLGARMAFPCFDEPALKATFKIRIQRHPDYSALSNGFHERTILIPDEDSADWVQDEFDETVIMSTYLVAMIVSDFKSVDAPDGLAKYGVKIWGQPTETDENTAKFSSESAAKILSFLETYLDYDYQFPKLDSAAIPQFAAGAMENWALNTYRVNLLLWWGREESTQYELWRSAYILAHEISHHWFGDLVTCDWWNEIWLNEGFANYMQFLGSTGQDSMDFQAFDRYLLDGLHLALDFDATANSVPVHSSDTVNVVGMPSRIIYEKAGALIRMMQTFLSEKTLQTGLQNYLKAHEYSTVIQQDLFDALQAQADIDGSPLGRHSLTEIMESWTLQTGFPLIRISNTGVPDRIYVSQEKFLLPSARGGDKAPFAELYHVPITMATKQNPIFDDTNWAPRLWIDKETLLTSTVIPGSINEWIIVNPDARNYYRVLYDDHFHTLIIAQLEEDHTVISRLSRAQLIDDYFKSSYAKYVKITNALDLSLHLSKETENTVWTTFFNNIRILSTLMIDQADYPLLKTYMLSRMEAVLDVIGWEDVADEPPHVIFLRAQLLDWSCNFGSTKCIELVTAWATDSTNIKIAADYQPMVYCKGIEIADSFNGGFNVREFILSQYSNAWRDERFTLFINALACESNIDEIQKLLTITIDGGDSSINKRAHGTPLLQKLASNPTNRKTVLDFLVREIETIKQELGEGAVSGVISSMSSYSTSSEAVANIKDAVETLIAEGNLSPNTITQLNNSIAQLSRNEEWISHFYKDISDWLQAHP